MSRNNYSPQRKHASNAPTPRWSVGEVFIYIVVVGVIAGGWYFVDGQSKRNQLATLRPELNDERKRLDESRKRVEARRIEVGALQDAADRFESLGQQKVLLKAQIPDLDRSLASMRAELAMTTQEVRTKAVGTTLAALHLTDGEVLHEVGIRAVSDFDISVSHSGGVARIPGSRLPNDLQQRFRFGIEPAPVTEASQMVAAAVSPQPAPPANTTVAPNPKTSSPRVLTDDQRRRIDVLNGYVLAKKNRISELHRESAREGAAEQRARSAPATPTNAQRDLSNQLNKVRKADTRAREVAYLQRQIVDILSEISSIKSGSNP